MIHNHEKRLEAHELILKEARRTASKAGRSEERCNRRRDLGGHEHSAGTGVCPDRWNASCYRPLQLVAAATGLCDPWLLLLSCRCC